eukprot:4205608-Amphidinium_carterae.1
MQSAICTGIAFIMIFEAAVGLDCCVPLKSVPLHTVAITAVSGAAGVVRLVQHKKTSTRLELCVCNISMKDPQSIESAHMGSKPDRCKWLVLFDDLSKRWSFWC